MKKFLLTIFIGLFIGCVALFVWNVTLAQEAIKPEKSSSRNYNKPIRILDSVKWTANKPGSDPVQKTDLDNITSAACAEIAVDSRFSISRTLCNLKRLSRDYMQYVMYFGLTAATILLIRNWFKIVTSTDREKEMTAFKKNIVYVIIWVLLLIWFYYIIDIFVSVVNLITE